MHLAGQFTLKDFEQMFRGDALTARMPLLSLRYQHLIAAYTILCDKFDGSYANLVVQCNGSAQQLIELVLLHFESFNDTAQYGDAQVML